MNRSNFSYFPEDFDYKTICDQFWTPSSLGKLELLIRNKLLAKGRAFVDYRSAFRNYTEVIWHILLDNYPFQGQIRKENRRVLIPNHWLAYTISRGLTTADYSPSQQIVSFDFRGRTFYFSGALVNGDLASIFVDGEYSFLNVKNEVVVDVGANIGDSSIYFAAMEADHVYSLEPYPSTFEEGKKNIELNHLKEKITLVNAGLSNEDTEVRISPHFRANASHDVRNFHSGVTVPLFSLRKLVIEYGIEDAVLKMDCEGCEYVSILSTDKETLRKFKQIQIEYHYGASSYLLTKLRQAGFTVSITKTGRDYNEFNTRHYISRGNVLATRT